jgi:hypothetical protein
MGAKKATRKDAAFTVRIERSSLAKLDRLARKEQRKRGNYVRLVVQKHLDAIDES